MSGTGKCGSESSVQVILHSLVLALEYEVDMEVSAHSGLHVNYTQALMLREPSLISDFLMHNVGPSSCRHIISY